MPSHHCQIPRSVIVTFLLLAGFICQMNADGFYDKIGTLTEGKILLVANDFLVFSNMVENDYGKMVEQTNIVLGCSIESFYHDSIRDDIFTFPLSDEEVRRIKIYMRYRERSYAQNIGLFLTGGIDTGQGFQSSSDINEFFDIPDVSFGTGVWHWDLASCVGFRNIVQFEGRFSYRNSRMKYEGETVVAMDHTSWQILARLNPNILNWGYKRFPADLYLVFGLGRSPGYMIPELGAGFADGKVNTYGLFIGGPVSIDADEQQDEHAFMIMFGGFSLEYENVTYRKIDYSDGGIGDLDEPISVGCLKFLVNLQIGGRIF